MSESVEFEKLTAEIFSILRNNPSYETVIHNTTLQGKDGPRQIDILLIGKIGPLEISTIIECKDYNKIVDVTNVDALHSKMQDVNAHKGVLVARKGFSKQAIRKAKRLGITLCTAHKAKTEKWNIPIEIPVVIEEINPELNPQFRLKIEKQQTFNKNAIFKINDIDILEEFKNSWNDGSLEIREVKQYKWQPKRISPPYYIRNDVGEQLFIDNLQLNVNVNTAYYFGYINELDNSKAIQFIIEGKTNIIYNNTDLIEYKTRFIKYRSRNELPNINTFMLQFVNKIKIEFVGLSSLHIKKIE